MFHLLGLHPNKYSNDYIHCNKYPNNQIHCNKYSTDYIHYNKYSTDYICCNKYTTNYIRCNKYLTDYKCHNKYPTNYICCNKYPNDYMQPRNLNEIFYCLSKLNIKNTKAVNDGVFSKMSLLYICVSNVQMNDCKRHTFKFICWFP